MTYLDSRSSDTRRPMGSWIIRLAFILGLLAFGWFALTVGGDGNGRPDIVSEPVSRSF